MTIKRNVDGNEMDFELTYDELCHAFFEQERNFDVEEIAWEIESMTSDDIYDRYGVSRDEFESLIPDMAKLMRRCMNNDDGLSDLRAYAIDETIQDYLKGN